MNKRATRVLFVGNSYTFYNDMPEKIFSELASNAGYEVDVTSITRGGYKLCQFADPENAEGVRLRETIRGVHYDCAILQEQSLNPIKNEEEFLEGVKAVTSLIDADKFVLYATWGRNDESPDLADLGLTREEMTERLSRAYNKAAELCGADVAEVGFAFLEYSRSNNKDELYKPDHSHPSALGSEIAARVIFEKCRSALS